MPTIQDLHIIDRNASIQPVTPNRAQSALLASLTGRDLIVKPRQIGISTIVQAHYFIAALSQTARVTTVAHDEETTQKLRDMTQFFYDELSSEDRPPRFINNARRTYYPATRSWMYYTTAGNPRAGRGGTYTHVHGSEVAHWKDASKIVAGLLQGVPANGSIIFESTPNGAQGWFYEQVMAAQAGKGIWTVHFFPWWWDKSYRLNAHNLVMTADERSLAKTHKLKPAQIAWRRAKQAELGELFPQEYPEDLYSAFIKSGDGYFRLAPQMFAAPLNATFNPQHRYVAGLDFGQSNDFTVCVILDVTARQQVDLLRVRRRSWAEMRHLIVECCRKWHVHTLVAEVNSMGSPNIEALREELAASRLSTTLMPFHTSHTSKTTILAELRLALEEQSLKLLPDPAQQHELASFTSRQLSSGIWQLAAPGGTNDDCVIALALAHHAVTAPSLRILF
jgi:hypothetical protein